LLQANDICLVRQFLKRQERKIEVIAGDDTDKFLKSPLTWYPSELSSEGAQISYESTKSGEQHYAKVRRDNGISVA